jgi:hypothetical protein
VRSGNLILWHENGAALFAKHHCARAAPRLPIEIILSADFFLMPGLTIQNDRSVVLHARAGALFCHFKELMLQETWCL